MRILFVCTHNSARSQMAEGWAHVLARAGLDVQGFSAGTEKTFVRPLAIHVMAELGIDISGQESETLDRYAGESFDVVVTVCDSAAAACPAFPGTARREHWPLPDPSRASGSVEQQTDAYRRVRDALAARIVALVAPATGE